MSQDQSSKENKIKYVNKQHLNDAMIIKIGFGHNRGALRPLVFIRVYIDSELHDK